MKKNFLIIFITTFFIWQIGSAQDFRQSLDLGTFTTSASTSSKPQSKVWTHDGYWFAVMPSTSAPSGTYIYRLDCDTWTRLTAYQLSSSTDVNADVKVDGSVIHVALFSEANDEVELVSSEYVSGTNSYQAWTTRPGSVTISTATGTDQTQTATIDIDSNGRMWLAYDYNTNIDVKWSDSPYSTWSSGINIANNVDDDDICVVVPFDGDKIGVFWSNQNTERFGFSYHNDADPVGTWSADEVPGDTYATSKGSIGDGMADNHMNAAVASDGTIYMIVKTSYDDPDEVAIGLFERNSTTGTWSFYEVDNQGTQPVLLLDETASKLYLVYQENFCVGEGILVQTTSTGSITFDDIPDLVIRGDYNQPTTTKQNVSGEMVVLARDNANQLVDGFFVGERALSYDITVSTTGSGTVSPSGTVNVPTGVDQTFTITPTAGSYIQSITVDGEYYGSSTSFTFRNASCTASSSHTIDVVFAVDPGTSDELFQFDMEESGCANLLNDATNNGNDAIMHGQIECTTGKPGIGARFSEDCQYGAIPDNPTLDVTNALSIAFWIRPERRTNMNLIQKGLETSSAEPPYRIELRTNQKVRIALDGGSFQRLSSSTLYPDDGTTWMHIAFTWDGSTIRLYVNGVLDASTSYSSTLNTNNEPLYIGGNPSRDNGFEGTIDDSRMYNRELTAAEVTTIYNLGGTFPVEFSDFEVSLDLDNGAVDLDWATASELNNDYFTIERSVDARIFEPLGNVNGNGTSTELHTYEFKDVAPFIGENYYRLKQVDIDGQFSYSPTRSVLFTPDRSRVFIYPNPLKNGEALKVIVPFERTRNASMRIVSSVGQLVHERTLDADQTNFSINMERPLAPGIYIVQVRYAGTSISQRLLIQ